ncbi:uncharacterized protein A4U43_C02F2170 [Asparagus officinalis]|uniref:Extensin domain-containing protein n=1 Tax=Asparagus officinalis TaxID=4686 RepID=A0A5P1FJ99_ASPOF|nr:uncharacterized protein A4U43_C02F2170 [Asparagus officinalis]
MMNKVLNLLALVLLHAVAGGAAYTPSLYHGFHQDHHHHHLRHRPLHHHDHHHARLAEVPTSLSLPPPIPSPSKAPSMAPSPSPSMQGSESPPGLLLCSHHPMAPSCQPFPAPKCQPSSSQFTHQGSSMPRATRSHICTISSSRQGLQKSTRACLLLAHLSLN